MQVFINEQFFNEREAFIPVNDRGFLLGDGLFETLKSVNGKIAFFNHHYDRLKASAEFLNIPLNYTEEQLKEICLELLKLNHLINHSCAIRITLTRGSGVRGIALPFPCTPTLLITAAMYAPSLDFYPKAFITSIRRNEFSPLINHKTLNYLEPILARSEAMAQGYDEGIMLNTKGFISECSIANIFFINKDIVLTPSNKSGVLPGIVRNKIIQICHQNNIVIIEKKISPEEALEATEAFQTNSLIGIQFLSKINNHSLGILKSNTSQKIAKSYFDYITGY